MRDMMVYTLLLFSLLGMASCAQDPANRYFNPGDAENQLIVVTEEEYIDLSAADSMRQLETLLNTSKPKEAVINCPPERPFCKKATAMLNKAGIAHHGQPEGSILTLYYEKVIGKDCNSRYVDNSQNPYNLNHSSFGCAMRANTVQMVSDKQQFINPRLLDYMDGEKAAHVYDSYLNPAAESASEASSTEDSLVPSSSQ